MAVISYWHQHDELANITVPPKPGAYVNDGYVDQYAVNDANTPPPSGSFVAEDDSWHVGRPFVALAATASLLALSLGFDAEAAQPAAAFQPDEDFVVLARPWAPQVPYRAPWVDSDTTSHGLDEDFYRPPVLLAPWLAHPFADTDEVVPQPVVFQPDEDYWQAPKPTLLTWQTQQWPEQPEVPYNVNDYLAPFGTAGNNFPAQGFTVGPWSLGIATTETVGALDPLGGNAASLIADTAAVSIHRIGLLGIRSPTVGNTYRATFHFAPGTYPLGCAALVGSSAIAGVYVTNAGIVTQLFGAPFNLTSTPEANGFFEVTFDYVSDGFSDMEVAFGPYIGYGGTGQNFTVYGFTALPATDAPYLDEDFWLASMLPVPVPATVYQQLPINDFGQDQVGPLKGQPDEDYWLQALLPAPTRAALYQQLPLIADDTWTPTTPPVTWLDEDFWQNPVAPAQGTLYQRLPLTDYAAESWPLFTPTWLDEDFFLPRPMQYPALPVVPFNEQGGEWYPALGAFPVDEVYNLANWLPAPVAGWAWTTPFTDGTQDVPPLRGQPDEDFWAPPLPWVYTYIPPFLDSGEWTPPPVAFLPDEDRWAPPRPWNTLPNLLGGLWLGDDSFPPPQTPPALDDGAWAPPWPQAPVAYRYPFPGWDQGGEWLPPAATHGWLDEDFFAPLWLPPRPAIFLPPWMAVQLASGGWDDHGWPGSLGPGALVPFGLSQFMFAPIPGPLGYIPAEALGVTAPTGERQFDFSMVVGPMPPAFPIDVFGFAADFYGYPLAGVRIICWTDSLAFNQSLFADANGRFVFRQVPGRYNLCVVDYEEPAPEATVYRGLTSSAPSLLGFNFATTQQCALTINFQGGNYPDSANFYTSLFGASKWSQNVPRPPIPCSGSFVAQETWVGPPTIAETIWALQSHVPNPATGVIGDAWWLGQAVTSPMTNGGTAAVTLPMKQLQTGWVTGTLNLPPGWTLSDIAVTVTGPNPYTAAGGPRYALLGLYDSSGVPGAFAYQVPILPPGFSMFISASITQGNSVDFDLQLPCVPNGPSIELNFPEPMAGLLQPTATANITPTTKFIEATVEDASVYYCSYYSAPADGHGYGGLFFMGVRSATPDVSPFVPGLPWPQAIQIYASPSYVIYPGLRDLDAFVSLPAALTEYNVPYLLSLGHELLFQTAPTVAEEELWPLARVVWGDNSNRVPPLWWYSDSDDWRA